jgi:amino acid transporter
MYAMANVNMLPKVFAVIHPKYKTPVNAIFFITVISAIAAIFGKEMITWLVNAGGAGIVASWALVSLAFYQLRKKEPLMNRPYKVRHGKLLGIVSFILSLSLLLLYFPGSPSALSHVEWSIIGCWLVMGAVFYLWAVKTNGRASMKIKMDQHIAG